MRGRAWLPVFALAAAVFPFCVDGGGPAVGTATLALAYTVMALGLNLIVGLAGLLDLGYVAFFAIGSYTIAWLGSMYVAGVGDGSGLHVLVGGVAAELPGIHVSFPLVLVAAVALTTVAGVLVGVPTLRLRGSYIAVVTLAFGEIISIAAVNGDRIVIAGQPLTAARRGVTPIDKIDLPFLPPFTALQLRPWYFTALALLVAALWVSFALRESRLGRAWIALRDDEAAAVAAGVPANRTKLLAYGTGAAFAGISGAFLGSFNNTVNAAQFEFSFSILILTMVVLGGLGSIWGVTIAALTLGAVHFALLPRALPGDASQYSYAVYGVLLVAVVRVRWGRREPRSTIRTPHPAPAGAARAGRWETLGSWLGLWTPPRDRSVPPVPWRVIGAGGALALVLSAAAVAAVAPRIQDAKSEAAARERRQASVSASTARARQEREQRARLGTLGSLTRVTAIGRVQERIASDARARFDPRAKAADCRPVGGQPPRATRVVFDCFVALRTIVGAGQQAGARGLLGIPYRAAIDFHTRRFAFCKVNPRPGERLVPDPRDVVPLPPPCR
jgi:branched-chain amino acid transport system permease protein